MRVPETPSEFYDRLSGDYATTIRQLVPHYDEMIGEVGRMLEVSAPARILDIGAGDGSLTRHLAHQVSGARFVALEPASQMANRAREMLAEYQDRCLVVETNALEYQPEHQFEAVYTNLVLHNLDAADKRQMLRRIRHWMVPNGVFVWGDFIRASDAVVHERHMAERLIFARSAGCPQDIIAANFAKERLADDPWTIDAMLTVLGDVGFRGAACAWDRGTFAILVATRGV